MWDATPFIDALFRTAHPSVQAQQETLREHIQDVVLNHNQRRPDFAAQAMREIAERPMGFVYDRPSALVFPVGFADHERCAGALMMMRELRAPVDWRQARWDGNMHNGKAADRYLDGGHGFIANSPQLTERSGRWPLRVGADVVLTAQEKIWFKSLVLQRD